MGEYEPPFTITNEMLSYVASISEKIGRITATSNLEAKPHLRKNNRIKSIHSSLKIEANSLTLGQVRDVINGKTVLGEQKEIQEVKNAYAAYEQFSEIDPYNIKLLKRFHGIMTKYVVEESGDFRHGEEGIFNGNQCIFMAPPARFVPKLMDDLFSWMTDAKNSVHPLILSSVFHYEFELIHPFADGNGRMGRLWHTLLLSKWNPIFAWLPIESIIHDNQSEYYNAINVSNNNGNSTVFIEFMLSVIKQALQESINDKPKNISSKSDLRWNKINDYLETHEYILNSDVQKLLGVSSATATRILVGFMKDGKLKRIRIKSCWGYVTIL